MKNTKIIINTRSKTYPIYFGDGILKSMGKLIKKNIPKVKKIVIIGDKKINPISFKKLSRALKNYEIKIYKLSSSENSKSFGTANKLIQNLLKDNLNRSDCVIAFGGGILGDLAAFVASLTKRGIKFVNIPTTLLAQVDASIGGKTGVNSNLGKNLIGTFYQPEFVLIDLAMLNTLHKREMVCGYAEILKHSLISDKKLFLWLRKNAYKIINLKDKKSLTFSIIKSCKIKSAIVNKDEKEKNLRMILNFGHTFAHGFEGAKNFSKKLNHGEAVLLGMIAAAKLSHQKKLLKQKDLILLKNHYLDLGLPMNIKDFFKKNEIKKIIYFMLKDKKNVNEKINLILLKKIGKILKPIGSNISVNELKKFLISRWN